MMLTIIEGRVAQENWALLEQAFQNSVQNMPAGLEQTFLVHQIEDRELWQIITIWSGMPSLQQIRRVKEAGITPRGQLIFEEAHGEQFTHAVFEVIEHRSMQQK